MLDYFQGQLLNRVICGRCGHESLAFDTFQDLSLSISRSLSILEDFTLERLIEHYSRVENLDEAYCGKCKKHQRSKQKFSFWRLPKILVFHLKRFNYRRFSSDKLTHRVIFPIKRLDVSEGKRIPPALLSREAQCPLRAVRHRQPLRKPLRGALHSVTRLVILNQVYSECKNPQSEKWYRYNDSCVSEIEIGHCGYERTGSGSPYILFYWRRE